MASLRVLAFDHEGRPVQFDTWLDDLQQYLLSDIKDGVSLFDHLSSAATATWRVEFGDDVELPRWADLLRSRIATFDLDFDAILSALYALSVSAEGDCYRCVPPDLGIAAAALGASESGTLPGTAPTQALHTFTLDSGASACFFRDSTTLTPLPTPVPVRLADPSGGPIVARSSSVLPCPAVPSGSLSGLHLPSFFANLVSTAALQDAMVTTTAPGGQRVTICTCTRTGRLLATFTRRPRSSLYTLATEPPQVAASAQVSASSQVAASCSCRLLSHQTLLWHRRVGHPSLPRLRGMHSRLLVSSLPRSLPLLPPSPATPCLPCVEGRQRAAPHSSSFPLTTAPLHVRCFRTVPPHWVRRHGVFSDHALNLWPRVFLLETSPTLRWTGEVGDASVFRVWGSRAFVRDTSADKLSPHVIPCDVTFDESVPFYRLFPYCSAPPPPLPLFLAPGPPPIDPLPPQGLAPSGVSQVYPLSGPAPVQVAVGSGATRGAAAGGAASGGEELGGAESEGAETGGAEPGGVEIGGAEPGGAELEGVLRRRVRSLETVSAATGGAGAEGAGGAGVVGVGVPGGTPTTGPGGARTRGTGAARTGGVEGAGAGDPTESGATAAGSSGVGVGAGGFGAVDPSGDVRPRPYFVPLLQQVLGTPSSTDLTPPLLCPPPDQLQPMSQPASPLPAPSPYTEQSGGLTERREPVSRPVSPVRTACRVPHSRPPPVLGTHAMTLRPSSVLLRVPLPAPPESSVPEVPDLESDRARAARPTVSRLLATAIIDPTFEFAAASALVAELLDFAAACRLDYTTALVAESASASPPSVGGECAFGADVLEDRQEDFECLAVAVPRFASMLLAPEGDPDASDIPTPRSYAKAIRGPYSSQWQAAMDAEMASWKSTGTYVDEVPPPGANIADGMWIFRVKRPPDSPLAFKALYVAQGFSQRQGVDYFHTFSSTPKMTTLRVLLNVAAQRDYELHSLDFSTAFLQGSLHEEIWLRRPPGFTESFPAGTLWSLRQPVYGLRKVPHEWHDTLRTTLAALGFDPATADPSLFLRTDTSLPPLYILVYVDDLVFATADPEALTLVKSELPKRHTCTDLGELHSYLGLQITRDRAQRTITLTQSHMVHQVLQCFGFHFSSPQPTPLSTTHSLSAPPLDESVEPSGPYPELVGCLITSGIGLVLGGRGPVVLTGHADASW
ncbi:unnamed protein product, partial [Closterium sp. NIES-54]